MDIPGLPQVRGHVDLQVLGTEVALSSEEHLNVLLGSVENAGEVSGGHDCDLCGRMFVVVVVVAKFRKSMVQEVVDKLREPWEAFVSGRKLQKADFAWVKKSVDLLPAPLG